MQLKKNRAPVRASITKICDDLDTLQLADPRDEVEIEALIAQLGKMEVKLDDLDKKIIDKMVEEDKSDQDILNEQETIDKYNRKIAKTKVKAKKSLTAPDSTTVKDSNHKRFKLPDIKLKDFSGDLKDWLPFWAQFEKIHLDQKLGDADKFQYLAQCMVKGSRAEDLLSSYPQTSQNYPKVISALKARFLNEKLLGTFYVREMIKLIIDNATRREKAPLAKVYDRIESQLRSLESLGVTTEKYDIILFPMVESCLTEEVLIAWERSPISARDGSKENPPKNNLDLLLEFLKSDVMAEERIKQARGGLSSPTAERKSNNDNKRTKSAGNKSSENDIPTAATLAATRHSNTCIFCTKPHDSDKCGAACTMTLAQKQQKVRDLKACQQCLKPHHGDKCKMFVKCVVCQGKHYPIVCPNLPKSQPQSEKKTPNVDTVNATVNCSSEVLLKTLKVRLVGEDNIIHYARVLIDDGSQRSYIKKSTANLLNMKAFGVEALRTSVFGGAITEIKNHNKYKTRIFDVDGKVSRDFTLLEEEKVVSSVPKVSSGPWIKEFRKMGMCFSDDLSDDNLEIEILLGSDSIPRILTGKMRKLKCGLSATETIYGWTIQGQVIHKNSITNTVISSFCHSSSIKQLWDWETLGIRDPIEIKSEMEKEVEAMESFRSSLKVEDDGRYVVGLPWTEGVQNIPSNRGMAEKSLLSITKTLMSKYKYETYDKIFTDWLAEGFIEEVSEDSHEKYHYLPHHPVFKESLTTPVRPVFNASFRIGRNPSLNDCLYKGPNLLELIPTVLLRFREKKIGCVADIRKAFQMISLKEEDRNFVRFLWWNEDRKTIKIFRHARVPFGLNSSPFLLAATITHHLNNVSEENKATATNLLKSLYVDNSAFSVNTVEEYNEFRSISTKMLEEAKMELRLWESNVETENKNPVTSVLGLQWDKINDTIFCITPSSPDEISKRTILSQISKIFDPIGFTGPALIQPKMLLQETWNAQLDWDSELNSNTKKLFRRWCDELINLEVIRIPKQAIYSENKQIHLFVDASQLAYAAVIFLRSETPLGIKVQLVQAKNRVAPLKKPTIPRLELMSCLIGARLYKEVVTALEYQDVRTFMWTDSSTALAWIRRCDQWGTFVGNRVKEILTLVNPNNWNHIPGIHNPADLPSRGCSPSELLESRWWEGPAWLYKPKEEWPISDPIYDEDSILKEKCKTTISSFVHAEDYPEPRFSLYSKNVAVNGWILRFVNNCKHKHSRIQKKYLTMDEMRSAELMTIRQIQQESIHKKDATELDGIKVTKINDIYRVDTKLIRGSDTENFKRPMLLPKNHPLVQMMITELHNTYGHAGVQFTMRKLRDKYWIPQCRRTVRSIINKCVRCKRYSAKSMEVDTAALPQKRITIGEAFQVTGVDLAGPMHLKTKTSETKVWIVLYTCATYRCVHLDLVESLSTEAFLNSLERFICTQGRPIDIFSDNGTNFVGSVNLMKMLKWNEIEEKLQVKKINWIFNPPTAAWWGGWWERLVRTTKDLLKRILHKSKLSSDELRTCIAAVSQTINDRPLTTVTEDIDDLCPLTPSMFMRPLSNLGFPEGQEISQLGLQTSYKRMQDYKRQLQSRFRNEYLSQLVQFSKKRKCSKPPRIGDIVLIRADNTKRIFWKLGRITDLIAGGDGKIRVATLKTTNGQLTRPLQRLYPLEVIPEDVPIPKVDNILNDNPQDIPLEENNESTTNKSPKRTRFGREIKAPARFWNM